MYIYMILFYFFQILFLAYYFDWHIPVRLRNALLPVVGGFPNFVHSQYYDLANATYPLLDKDTDFDSVQLISLTSNSRYRWECNTIFGDGNTCFSVVSEKYCHAGSQYSFEYWKSFNNLTRCVKAGQEVLCANATTEGKRCLNIAGTVHIRKTSTLVELEDETIGEVIAQKLHIIDLEEEVFHPCYESHDHISVSSTINTIIGDEAGKCIKGNLLSQFGVNTSSSCSYVDLEKNCTSIQHQLLEWWRTLQPSLICNCGSCKVPYLEYAMSPPSLSSEDCLLPLESLYLFTFYRGSIKGVVNKLIWSAVNSSNPVFVRKKVLFVPLETSSPLSRFQVKRGRFRCPADSGCWKSFFYIFGRFEVISWPHQIALIVTALMFTLVIIRQKPVAEGRERKFPFAYFPGNTLKGT